VSSSFPGLCLRRSSSCRSCRGGARSELTIALGPPQIALKQARLATFGRPMIRQLDSASSLRGVRVWGAWKHQTYEQIRRVPAPVNRRDGDREFAHRAPEWSAAMGQPVGDSHLLTPASTERHLSAAHHSAMDLIGGSEPLLTIDHPPRRRPASAMGQWLCWRFPAGNFACRRQTTDRRSNSTTRKVRSPRSLLGRCLSRPG